MAMSANTDKRNKTTFGIDPKHVDIARIVEDVHGQMSSGLTTEAIDDLAIRAALRATSLNPAYIWIAGHIEISKMHKALHPGFSYTVKTFLTDSGDPSLADEFLDVVQKHHQILDDSIVHLRDFDHTYRHITHDVFMSRHGGAIDRPTSSSCAMTLVDVDVRDVYDAIARCVFAARNGRHVAISAQQVPCSGRISTCQHDDSSIGLWSMLKLLEGALSFTRRKDDKRSDVANICVEPWHIDIKSVLEFVNVHQNGLCDQKGITVTMSVPDIFIARVEDDEPWSLFCPVDVPNLTDLQGSSFEHEYLRYESSSTPQVKIQARDLWDMMIRTITLTGGPSILFKDAINDKSNIPANGATLQSDLRTGLIDVLGTSCELLPRNHASIALPLFVAANGTFDFGKLQKVTGDVVINLNRILDAALARSQTIDRNKDYRIIAVGAHGLADAFAALRLPYDSPEAASLNSRIAETMYYAALKTSCDLAETHGAYAAFQDSPLARGKFQFDLWGATPLKTATGYTDSTDPALSNIDDDIVCPWLVRDLTMWGIWSDNLRDQIIDSRGLRCRANGNQTDLPDSLGDRPRNRHPHDDAKSTVRLPHTSSDFTSGIAHSGSYGELLMHAWASGLKTGLHKLHTRCVDQSSKDPSSYESDADGEMSFDDLVLSGSF
ncbi:hypothetical protein B0H13DRAFT_1924268 [Mycena leptocephala]|nr:hypothetical protein B0H13DRAFT_1924268 [Mycena leptocephala]